MKTHFFTSVAALAVTSILAGSACTCGTPNNGGRCAALGESCADGKLCCQGVCNFNKTCDNTFVACTAPGQACTNNNDCCTYRCDNGVCSSEKCVDNEGACSANSNCCTGNCSAGTCAPIPGASSLCSVRGQKCSLGSECCSTNCDDGYCAPQSTCKATEDVCYDDLDCCSKLCSRNDGSAGYCILPPGGCVQDGMPCEGASNCCTRICADPGSGVTVCLSATGCVMTGAACLDEQACCGGGTNPNGSVMCERQSSADAFGRCDNGQACNPVGNICGAPFPLPDGGTFKVNASQDCCDGKKEVCKRDSSGIPRCFGGFTSACPTGYTGVAPCCIAHGDVCQFKDQCCDGAPCVPDETGTLRCSQGSCTPLGATCTFGQAVCCSGQCIGDEFGFVCRIPIDAGVGSPDANLCKANGSTCTSSGQCCSFTCTNGKCQTPIQCQASLEVCTGNADCCTGLSCVRPSDALSGICKANTGNTCALDGQPCSLSNPCCDGLNCLQSGSYTQLCNDTTTCTCTSIVN
jgi:hypothetical protein